MADTWIPILLFGIGAAATVSGVQDLRRLRRSRDWPETEGTILESRVKQSWSDGSLHETLVIRYIYSVDGTRYTGRRVFAGGHLDFSIGGHSSGRAWSTAREVIDRYPAGSPCFVRYNPNHPGDACLESGGTVNVAAELAVGFGCLLGGAYALR